jgi:hypothetical protein
MDSRTSWCTLVIAVWNSFDTVYVLKLICVFQGLAITLVSDEGDAKILNEVQDRFDVNISELPDEIDLSSYSKFVGMEALFFLCHIYQAISCYVPLTPLCLPSAKFNGKIIFICINYWVQFSDIASPPSFTELFSVKTVHLLHIGPTSALFHRWQCSWCLCYSYQRTFELRSPL